MPPPCGFLLPCAVAFVVGIGRCREVSGQANDYDTATTDAFRITCNPAPGKCDIGDPFSLYSAMIHPMNGITGNPADGGLIRLDTESAYFVAGGCKPQKNCTVLCDDNCGCETGGFALDDVGGRWFASDGGSCAVLDTTPGDVPTDAPTPVPTSSPTFDKAEAILYDFTGLARPSVMRIFGCMALGGGPFDSYCELRSGIYRYTISTNSFYGVSECDEGEPCILACSKACSCEMATEGEEGTEDCTIVAPTDSPSQSPSEGPTSKSPTSPAVAKTLGLAARVAVGGFFVLGMV